jgi:hypothetical protein
LRDLSTSVAGKSLKGDPAMANDFDKDKQQSGQQNSDQQQRQNNQTGRQQGDVGNRADELDEQLKRKDNEGIRKPEDQGANRPDREGSENIERKRSA